MPAAVSSTSVKSTRRRAQLSCDRCRTIKRKCDRNQPCNRCTEFEQECIYTRPVRGRYQPNTRVRRRRESLDMLDLIPETSNIHDLDDNQVNSSEQSSSTAFSPSNLPTSASSRRVSDSNGVQLHPTKTTSSPTERFHTLAENRYFVKQVVEIYCEELDQFSRLMGGSRLHRLTHSREYNSTNDINQLEIWSDIKCHLQAAIAAVSLMCPASVEIVLSTMDYTSRQGFDTAAVLSTIAYDIALSNTTAIFSQTCSQSWPAEIFAASLILRRYEKNAGLMQAHGDGILLDVARLQRAGYHQRSFTTEKAAEENVLTPISISSLSSIPSTFKQQNHNTIWQEEHNDLAYRVVCEYLGYDRLVSFFTGSGYSLQARYIDVCLIDPYGHESLQTLCDEDGSSIPLHNRTDCGAVACHQATTINRPTLNAYEGAHLRIAIMSGRYYDKLNKVRLPSFQWPQDAEQMTIQMELETMSIEQSIDKLLDNHPDALSSAQRGVLSLVVNHLRRELAKRLSDAFVTKLLRLGNGATRLSMSQEDGKRIQWLLQCRKLEASKTLIFMAINSPRQLSVNLPNWIFLPKFLALQCQDLLDSVGYWLNSWKEGKIASSSLTILSLDNIHAMSSHQIMEKSKANLLDCLRYTLMARNFLVVFARRSDLVEVKRQTKEICEKYVAVMNPLLDRTIDISHVGASKDIVDEVCLVGAAEFILSTYIANDAPPTPPQSMNVSELPSHASLDNFGLDDSFASLFEDLPALEQLFFQGFDGNTSVEP